MPRSNLPADVLRAYGRLADACNIGLAAVADPTRPALSPDQLAWLRRQYVASEAISSAPTSPQLPAPIAAGQRRAIRLPANPPPLPPR